MSEEDILVRIKDDAALIHIRSCKPITPRGTIILIHGFCGSSQDFSACFPYFSSFGFSVIGVDMPGRGQSARLKTQDYRLDILIGIISQIIDHYASGPTILVGKTWGGALSMLTASTQKTRDLAVALIDVPPIWSLSTDPELSWAQSRLHHSYNNLKEALSDFMHWPGFRHAGLNRQKTILNARLYETADGFRHVGDHAILQNLNLYKDMDLDLTIYATSVGRLLILARYPDSWSKLADDNQQHNVTHLISIDQNQNDPLVNNAEMTALLGFVEQVSKEWQRR